MGCWWYCSAKHFFFQSIYVPTFFVYIIRFIRISLLYKIHLTFIYTALLTQKNYLYKNEKK